VKMTDEQKKLVEDYLARYSTPLKQFRALAPHMSKKAIALDGGNDELEQRCMLGLIRASKTYDESRGAMFATFAFEHMRSCVSHYLQSEERHRRKRKQWSSRSTVLRFEDLTSVVNDPSTALNEAMKTLPSKYRDVINYRYGLLDGVERSKTDTAECCGVSRERVRQMESSAMSKLQHHFQRRNITGEQLCNA
jgi:RNA polymerase sigma factor (sigma-70 family)